MRRFVESVFPTTRNTNGGRHTNGTTAADMTQFIADPAIRMPSIPSVPSLRRVITQPWCGISLPIKLSAMDIDYPSIVHRLSTVARASRRRFHQLDAGVIELVAGQYEGDLQRHVTSSGAWFRPPRQ